MWIFVADTILDINECNTTNDCSINAKCTNFPGSYVCTCNEGYEGSNGTVCEGIHIFLYSIKLIHFIKILTNVLENTTAVHMQHA